ncbi:MAG: glycosyl-4,4'-diaponeurosporenoate acyltransferase [Ruminococcaceae bacterium]|nr:glycosyl-4,4'-diaponeurosporenoate acyltransferase [Oscillospiraceae bacterium]
MNFIRCLLVLGILSFLFFVLGRVLPKTWFRYDSFLFKEYAFEQNGRIYDCLTIRRWKNKLPDMSRIFPRHMPAKRLQPCMGQEQVERFIQETCVAEWIHWLLALCGFICLYVWNGIGGVVVSLLYALGNIPFILVQRYNRPKLLRLYQRIKSKKDHVQTPIAELELQYEAKI